MVSETSVMPAATESKMAASSDMPRCPNTYELENEYQDFPKSTEDMPAEEYHELIRKYFKLKGLRHFEDFNEKEQEAVTNLFKASETCFTLSIFFTCITFTTEWSTEHFRNLGFVNAFAIL